MRKSRCRIDALMYYPFPFIDSTPAAQPIGPRSAASCCQTGTYCNDQRPPYIPLSRFLISARLGSGKILGEKAWSHCKLRDILPFRNGFRGFLSQGTRGLCDQQDLPQVWSYGPSCKGRCPNLIRTSWKTVPAVRPRPYFHHTPDAEINQEHFPKNI